MTKNTLSNVEIDERYFVETAARTMFLLQAVAAIDAPAPLTTIVERLGWSKPAVYRLVRTLEAIGALRQHDGKGYVLGPALITLGLSALQATGLVGIARPHLEKLHAEVEETVVLTMLDGREVVYLDRIEADKILIPRTRLGSRLPAYCTSTGQVLLAGLSDEDVHRRLEGQTFDRVGPNTLETHRRADRAARRHPPARVRRPGRGADDRAPLGRGSGARPHRLGGGRGQRVGADRACQPSAADPLRDGLAGARGGGDQPRARRRQGARCGRARRRLTLRRAIH